MGGLEVLPGVYDLIKAYFEPVTRCSFVGLAQSNRGTNCSYKRRRANGKSEAAIAATKEKLRMNAFEHGFIQANAQRNFERFGGEEVAELRARVEEMGIQQRARLEECVQSGTLRIEDKPRAVKELKRQLKEYEDSMVRAIRQRQGEERARRQEQEWLRNAVLNAEFVVWCGEYEQKEAQAHLNASPTKYNDVQSLLYDDVDSPLKLLDYGFHDGILKSPAGIPHGATGVGGQPIPFHLYGGDENGSPPATIVSSTSAQGPLEIQPEVLLRPEEDFDGWLTRRKSQWRELRSKNPASGLLRVSSAGAAGGRKRTMVSSHGLATASPSVGNLSIQINGVGGSGTMAHHTNGLSLPSGLAGAPSSGVPIVAVPETAPTKVAKQRGKKRKMGEEVAAAGTENPGKAPKRLKGSVSASKQSKAAVQVSNFEDDFQVKRGDSVTIVKDCAVLELRSGERWTLGRDYTVNKNGAPMAVLRYDTAGVQKKVDIKFKDLRGLLQRPDSADRAKKYMKEIQQAAEDKLAADMLNCADKNKPGVISASEGSTFSCEHSFGPETIAQVDSITEQEINHPYPAQAGVGGSGGAGREAGGGSGEMPCAANDGTRGAMFKELTFSQDQPTAKQVFEGGDNKLHQQHYMKTDMSDSILFPNLQQLHQRGSDCMGTSSIAQGSATFSLPVEAHHGIHAVYDIEETATRLWTHVKSSTADNGKRNGWSCPFCLKTFLVADINRVAGHLLGIPGQNIRACKGAVSLEALAAARLHKQHFLRRQPGEVNGKPPVLASAVAFIDASISLPAHLIRAVDTLDEAKIHAILHRGCHDRFLQSIGPALSTAASASSLNKSICKLLIGRAVSLWGRESVAGVISGQVSTDKLRNITQVLLGRSSGLSRKAMVAAILDS